MSRLFGNENFIPLVLNVVILIYECFGQSNASTGLVSDNRRDSKWVRVWSDSVSFELLPPFQSRKVDSVDSEIIIWDGKRYSIKYERVLTGRINWMDRACSKYLMEEGVAVCSNEHGVYILFDDQYGDGMHEIFINASFFVGMRVAIEIVTTWVNINKWDGLRLLYVDEGQAYLKNEIGIVRPARVGDRVTRDFGVISEIGSGYIIIIELAGDGLGGFIEIERTLSVCDCD